MKKIFISLTWLLCSMAAMAQGTGASDAFFSTERSDEDVSFSIRVGVNASTIVMGMEDYSLKTRCHTAYLGFSFWG